MPGDPTDQNPQNFETEGKMDHQEIPYAADIIEFGVQKVKEFSSETAGINNSPTLDQLEDLSSLIHSIELNPESFSCVEFPPVEKRDKDGQQRYIQTFRVLGQGESGLEVRFEQFDNFEERRQGIISQIVIAAEKIRDIKMKAESSYVSEDQAEKMFDHAQKLGELANRLAMKWVRKIDITLLKEGRDNLGVILVDAPGGLGIGIRDITDPRTLSNHGFLFDYPQKIKPDFTFNDVQSSLKAFPERSKRIINTTLQQNM